MEPDVFDYCVLCSQESGRRKRLARFHIGVSLRMTTSSECDPKLELFRHTLATLAYRAGKAVRNAPDEFAAFDSGEGSRTPAQILAHMGDLFDWALSIAAGKQTWHDSKPLPWKEEVERFFAALKRFERFPGFGQGWIGSAGKIVSGARGGCADAYRTTCDAAARGWSANEV